VLSRTDVCLQQEFRFSSRTRVSVAKQAPRTVTVIAKVGRAV
jgi:hypothetical protein